MVVQVKSSAFLTTGVLHFLKLVFFQRKEKTCCIKSEKKNGVIFYILTFAYCCYVSLRLLKLVGQFLKALTVSEYSKENNFLIPSHFI